MFCPQCGKSYEEKVNFCCHCGAAMFMPAAPRKSRKLTRSRTNKKIAGVCGGIAEHLDLDPTIVRLVWVMAALLGGWGLIGYLVAWIIMDEEPVPEAARAAAPAITPQPAPNH